MPRIPYLPVDHAEPADVVAAMRARRGGELNEADRTVLHAPVFARGFNQLMGSVRLNLSLPPLLRELAIVGVGYLNGSSFEVAKHLPELRKAGATEAQIAALTPFEDAPKREDLFDRAQRATMRLAIEMTRDVKVTDATFAEIQAVLPDDQSVVEMVGTIASYNMASRILSALEVE